MKPDLRVKKTKQLLYDTLIQWMEEKPFYEIKVVDLLRLSRISKNTFYRHYETVYDLYYEMLTDTFSQFQIASIHPEISSYPEEASYPPSTHYLIDFVLEHKRLLSVALKGTSPNILLEILETCYQNAALASLQNHSRHIASDVSVQWNYDLFVGMGSASTLYSITYILKHSNVSHDILANQIYYHFLLFAKLATQKDSNLP